MFNLMEFNQSFDLDKNFLVLIKVKNNKILLNTNSHIIPVTIIYFGNYPCH